MTEDYPTILLYVLRKKCLNRERFLVVPILSTRRKKENTSFSFPTPAATQVEPYLVGRGAGNGNGEHFPSRGPIFLS